MSQTIAGAFMSAVPVSPPHTFGNVHVGLGAYSKHDDGLGVGYEMAGNISLHFAPSAGAIWRLRYRLLAPIPTGTPKLGLVALANENSKVAKVQVKWGCAAMGTDPSSVALYDEGVTTITWGASDANKYVESKITLDGGALVDGSVLLLDLCFIPANWTLTKTSTWMLPMVVVEQ